VLALGGISKTFIKLPLLQRSNSLGKGKKDGGLGNAWADETPGPGNLNVPPESQERQARLGELEGAKQRP
jgi:hypothetical protein